MNNIENSNKIYDAICECVGTFSLTEKINLYISENHPDGEIKSLLDDILKHNTAIDQSNIKRREILKSVTFDISQREMESFYTDAYLRGKGIIDENNF